MQATRPGTRHIGSLDGMRGVAAMMVFLSHALGSLAMPQSVRAFFFSGPASPFLQPLGAVQLFFLLSGFCLASSADRGGSAGELVQFYVRRVFRIHPTYVFAFLAAWAASFFYLEADPGGGLTSWPFMAWSSVHLDAGQILRSLLYPSAAFGQLPVGWSLGVEMLFSFLLPVMMLLARRLHWGVVVGGSLLLLLRPHAASIQEYYPQYALDFALGIAVYVERARIERLVAGLGRAGRSALLLGSAAVFGLAVAVPREAFSIMLVMTGLGGTGLLVCAVHLPAFGRVLSSAPLARFGQTSYSFYCLHVTVLLLCGRLVTRPLGPAEALAFVALAFAVTTAAAHLSYRFVEKPSIRAGNVVCKRVAALTGRPAMVSRLVSS